MAKKFPTKKSDYTGNHGGAYVDIEGQRRQFTYIDHDQKSKLSGYVPDGTAQGEWRKSQDRKIREILALPACNATKNLHGLFGEFVDIEGKSVVWREKMVWDALLINPTLMGNLHTQVWRATVKEQFWFEDMPHEDILAGKWKEWM